MILIYLNVFNLYLHFQLIDVTISGQAQSYHTLLKFSFMSK